ncbi:phenylpyruvate tautomerase MIF-related protein [Maridesulfovibrio sp.]|uniref:phenylpyruvate tautomerase MIF-related protein n=1 Tax=Maridesulfovibrio sp. TaxID=2795000 RepID=UPI002A18D66B|nr:phenylpyruvate tautomerase MIF-related protein [Maridesulfovibrio sp.]
MPYIGVETNLDLGGGAEEFVADLSKLVAEILGKPESYVMVAVHDKLHMSFGGSSKPTAMLALKSLGLESAQCAGLSASLCGFMTEKIGIPADRIYIEFSDHDRSMFGWNSGTF